jgi:hypothetical protein
LNRKLRRVRRIGGGGGGAWFFGFDVDWIGRVVYLLTPTLFSAGGRSF